MNPALRRWTITAVKLVLTVAATYFLFRSLRLSWAEVGDIDPAAWRPRMLTLLASLLLVVAVFVYLVALWARMVRALGGPTLRLSESAKIFFVANLGRYIPGKVWQLAGLTYLAGRKGVSLPVASSAAVLGQIFALGAAVIVAGVALAVGATGAFPPELAPWALGLAALVAIVTVVPAALRWLLRLAFRVTRRSDDLPPIDAGFGIRWLGLYLPAWVGYGVAFGLLWTSFPTLSTVSWPGAVGAFAAAYFLGYAAVFAPAGVGVREGALAVLLSPWLSATGAAVLAVIARLWMTLAELVPVGWAAATGGFDWMRTEPEIAEDGS